MSLATRMSFATNGFRYLGGEYLFANIRHIDWAEEQKSELDRQGKRHTTYSARLIVTMANGKAVKITNTRQLSSTNITARKDVHEVMADAAKRLLERSFDARMDAYERDMKERRYVTWGRHQLTATGEIYYRHAFCFKLDNSKLRCILYPQRLVCMQRHKHWWSRLVQRFMFTSEVIDLERDRDCFLYVIRKYAGLFWDNEVIPLYRGVEAGARTAAAKDNPAQPQPEPTATPKVETPEYIRPEEAPKAEAPPPPPPPKPRLGIEHYMGILALPADSEWPTVKAEYRTLVKRYHPDLMRGRGAPEPELKSAEERLKTINEAFGWLEDYYRMKPK